MVQSETDVWPKVITIFVIVFIVAVIVCFMGIDMVDASHKGVMVNFGKILGVMEPDIKWTGLFTHTYQYDMRLRKAQVIMEGENYAPDKTMQSVYANIDVNYRLKPDAVATLYQNVGTDDVVEKQLNIIPIITEGFKRATVKYDATELADKREELAHLAEQNIRDRFPADYFEIDMIVVSNIHFTPEFQKALDDKKTAIQLTAVAKQNLEKVKFEQQQAIEVFKAQAEQLSLQKNEVTALLNQQKWIEKWDGKLPLYMITPPDTANMLLTLPQGGTQ